MITQEDGFSDFKLKSRGFETGPIDRLGHVIKEARLFNLRRRQIDRYGNIRRPGGRVSQSLL